MSRFASNLKSSAGIFFGVFAFFASEALAEVAVQAPEAKAWADSLTEKQLFEIEAPTKFTIVDSFANGDKNSGSPVYKSMNHKACRQVSYLDCVSSANASYSMLINDAKSVAGLAGVFGVTGADAVVYPVGDALFLSGDKDGQALPLKMKAKEIAKLDLRGLLEKMMTALGYDGVVLAISGDYVLVGSTDNRLKRPNLQGLAMADSNGKWSLQSAQQKGSSLLSLVNRSGGYGVFQEIVNGPGKGTVKPGTKIILESK